jgi:hypothetical protein
MDRPKGKYRLSRHFCSGIQVGAEAQKYVGETDCELAC